MAKETKSGKINPYYLSIASALLLSAAFLMGPFPVLIFVGVAPLFAIADHADGEHFWNKLELAGVALVVALFAAHTFRIDMLVATILQAIMLTIGFAAFTFTKQNLGPRLGKMPLIIFLLAIEYLILKAGFDRSVFFADAMQLKTGWLRWTSYTGYLGISFWILIANLLIYVALLRGSLSMPFLIMFLIVVTAPVAYSYTLEFDGVSRQDMLRVYEPGVAPCSTCYRAGYFERGEWIPRTATWVSALILLFAFVKSYMKKK